MKKKILLTGCAGFIGSNFVKLICTDEKNSKDYDFFIIDSLTYAGVYSNIENEINRHSHIEFENVDIRDQEKINELFEKHKFSGVINFAAESHVDRSIEEPNIFVETNVTGTLNLLNASKKLYQKNKNFRFLQVGTDEVYGTLKEGDSSFTEETPLAPNSPYSASKAGGDMLVRSFYETYGLPTIITRCSNNYGPYQFPEKLIPLMITNAKNDKSLPVYGEGKNIRDWIYVDDHNLGIWAAYTTGKPGEVYNFGGNSEMRNLDVVKTILSHLDKNEELITFVTDRLGHDYRYSIDYTKADQELGWSPMVTFDDGMSRTIEWYTQT